jgi:hypothetical protein
MKAHLFFVAPLFVADEAFLLVHSSRSTPTSILMSSTTSSDMMNTDKNVYRPEKVQEEFDTVVIGSEIGGLTAACLLAQQGQNVCVLEQHYVAGGAMHTFKSKGYRFATGIHYVGEMGEEEMPKSYWIPLHHRMTRLSGTRGTITLRRLFLAILGVVMRLSLEKRHKRTV